MDFIRAFRARHDPEFCHLVAPHYTLAFGCEAIAEESYVQHVAEIAAATAPIRFACRYAALGADDVDDMAYVFLVPDEGNAAIARLHDRIYSGPLAPHLRLDLPYVPHITIGRTRDRRLA